MIEANGKAQKMETKIGSPPLPPEGRSKTVLLLDALPLGGSGCCGGSIATAVKRRKVHDV